MNSETSNTAFTKCELIFPDVIEKALNWLIAKQERSGRFPEVGRIFDTDIQGGSSTGIALTAYVTLALVEAEMDRTLEITTNGKFSLSKNIAMDYLVKELQGLEDPYAISIVAYLLQLSSHPFRENVFNIMESKAVLSGRIQNTGCPIKKANFPPSLTLGARRISNALMLNWREVRFLNWTPCSNETQQNVLFS